MSISLLPDSIRDLYETHEWKHACPILKNDFPTEWKDILLVLDSFRLMKSEILQPGGGKSPIASKIDKSFSQLGWKEKGFDTRVLVDEKEFINPTHKIDCYKNNIGIELEWNNKDPFFDRDLNNFRILFELRAISVGVIITRCDELQELFNEFGKGKSYGQSTTHMSRLLPRIEGGGGGGCPLLVFGISKKLFIEDI